MEKIPCDYCDCCGTADEPLTDVGFEESTKPYVRITDWRIVDWPDGTKRLFGIPLDHPVTNLVSNTREVITSEIIDLNTYEGWVETMNTNYILMGEPLMVQP